MHRPLHVIQMNATNSLPDRGGIATYTHELAHHLALRGLSVKLITYPSSGRSRPAAISYPVVSFPSFDLKDLVRAGGSGALLVRRLLPKVLGMARDTMRVLRALPGGAGRVLWAVQWWPESFAAWLVSRIKGLPYCITAHGFEAVVPAEARRHVLYERVMNGAAAVFAVSRHTGGLLLQSGVRDSRIRVIPNGVRPERFDLTREIQERVRSVRDRFGIGGCYTLLTVGRLVERKGHLSVLEALCGLRTRIPEIRYVIAGDGPLRETLHERVAGLGLQGSVTLSGEVSEEDKTALLHACDVFVMPNQDIRRERGGLDTEGFGIVFLEAAACGKPVVGGKAGGAREAVVDGQTGLLVESRDRRELEEALYRLWADRALGERLGRQGLERVKREFTWEKIAALYGSQFEAVGFST